MISIVIALALEVFVAHMARFRAYGWADSNAGLVKKIFGEREAWQGPWGVLACLALPLLVIMLLQGLFHDVWLGLFELLFSIAVLVYCLRYQPLDDEVDRFIDAAEQNNEEQMTEVAARIMEKPASDSGQDRILALSDAIMSNAAERIFAVILWFALLGPMGALMYRLAWYYSERSQAEEVAQDGFRHSMARLYAILNWLPARLVVIGYAIVGSFEDVVHAWRESYQHGEDDMQVLNELILMRGGAAAIHIERYSSTDDDGNEQVDVAAVQAARGLVLRTLLAWGIVIAAITLTGWAS